MARHLRRDEEAVLRACGRRCGMTACFGWYSVCKCNVLTVSQLLGDSSEDMACGTTGACRRFCSCVHAEHTAYSLPNNTSTVRKDSRQALTWRRLQTSWRPPRPSARIRLRNFAPSDSYPAGHTRQSSHDSAAA
jgi:hypothetical protein